MSAERVSAGLRLGGVPRPAQALREVAFVSCTTRGPHSPALAGLVVLLWLLGGMGASQNPNPGGCRCLWCRRTVCWPLQEAPLACVMLCYVGPVCV